MYYIEIALFLIGAILLITGYRKTNRNLMLAAAIVLFLSASVDSFVGGFLEGYQQTRTAHQV